MHKKQHTLWLLAALAAPLAHFSGSGWLLTVLGALAVLPLAALPKTWVGMGKPLALAQILWLGITAGLLVPGSAAYWPSDNDLVVPLTILALAAVTTETAAPRVGAVLAFCMALLAVPPAVSGAAKLDADWLRPTVGPLPWALGLVLLLPNLPAAGKARRGRGGICAGVLAISLAVLVQGTISAEAAASVPDPFYQTARTLGHMEPVIAAGVTLGWYTLTVYLLSSARILAKESGIGDVWAGVLVIGTAAASVLFRVQLPQPIPALFGALFWVLIPFLHKIKNAEKTEKRC